MWDKWTIIVVTFISALFFLSVLCQLTTAYFIYRLWQYSSRCAEQCQVVSDGVTKMANAVEKVTNGWHDK